MTDAVPVIRVFYVDDSPFDRALVRDALEREAEGFELHEAGTREELEAFLASGKPFDLVLSDFNILGMTGLDVLQRIHEERPDVPVVLVTGTGSEEIAVEAMKAGASDYVIKQPQHIRRLPATIRSTLDSWRARRERDMARERLLQVERLEAVGRLAGGIAHDFNNLLTVIASNAALVLDTLEEDDPNREELAEIVAAARRGSELTRHLLLFSSGDVTPRDEVEPLGLLRETVQLLEKAMPFQVTLESSLPDRLPPVRTNAARLQQVVLNLGLNARDAIRGPGTVRLSVEALPARACAPLPADWTGPRDEVPILRIRVQDTGSGIPDEIRARIFEPFFTTKGPKGGTGLGLATAYGTVRQGGGTILLDSHPGEGSTFTVLLPFVPGSEAPGSPEDS
jgi:two-component system, cell cycle sensor histidine kinase and response regulator CckA